MWAAALFINGAAWAQAVPTRPIVSLEIIDRQAGETHPFQSAIFWGEFRVTRTGETNIDLPVYLRAPQGTAVFGVDYRLVGQYVGQPEVGPDSPVVILRGLHSVNVRLYPIDDETVEGDETAVITLNEPPAGTPLSVPYEIDPARSSGEFVIHDNEFPVVSLELVDGEARETLSWCEPCSIESIDRGEFRVTRTGGTNRELRVYFRLPQGTAILGVDYSLDSFGNNSIVRIPAGSRSVNVRLYPIDDALIEGDETAILGLNELPPGVSFLDLYRIDPENASVALVIHDDDPATPRVEITSPRDGQHFEASEVIPLRAQIIGLGAAEYWDVSFYDGDQLIGRTRPGGTIFWTEAIGGRHVINAIAHTIAGIPGMDTLHAAPVTILVGPGPAWPVVSLRTPRYPEKTGEPCPVCFTVPGHVIVSRTGPPTESLRVFLEADGTATPDVDYRRLPISVMIPPGTNAAWVQVAALDDQLAEGPEVVRARIDRPPELATLGYLVNARADQAYVVIGDDERDAPQARLDFLKPHEGAIFAAGLPIALEALGVFTLSEVDREVEFYSNGVLIGRSTPLALGRPSIPCLPNVHTFTWTNPPPGRHTLTARSEISLDTWVEAPPVRITVIDQSLHIFVQDDGTVTLVIPLGSLVPGGYDLEASSDLRTWTRLGPFQPGNVAAFYFEMPPPNARGRRFYRSVYHPVILP